jgi:hypothetical protein
MAQIALWLIVIFGTLSMIIGKFTHHNLDTLHTVVIFSSICILAVCEAVERRLRK